MYKLSVIIFLNCLIIYVSVEEKTNTSGDVNISVEPTAPVQTNASVKINTEEETKQSPIETNASVKTNTKKKTIRPKLLRNSFVVKEQIAEIELAEINSKQVLPLVLIPIFDKIKQTNELYLPQNIDHASVLEKRIVEGTEFTIDTALIEGMQGVKSKETNKIQEMYFCPKKISDHECLVPQTFGPSQKLQCDTEATPQVKRFDQGKNICGPGGIGIAYKIVYNICPNNSKEEVPQYETTEMEFYKFCYHKKSRRNLHTSHSIISPQLLYSNLLYRERKVKYSMMKNELTPSNRENSDNSSNKGQEPKSDPFPLSKKKPAYELQKLVPSEDMAFALWMKTTFVSINADWQHEDITPLWNKINEYVKSDAIRMFIHSQTIYHIDTAVVDTAFAKFATENDAQMSNLWVKMIHTTSTSKEPEGIAIFVNNFIDKTIANSAKENESENVSIDNTIDASTQVTEENERENDSIVDSITIDTSATSQSEKEHESKEDPNVTAGNAQTQISKKENDLENYCAKNLCPGLDKQFKLIGSRARCCRINVKIVDIFGFRKFNTNMRQLHISGIW